MTIAVGYWFVSPPVPFVYYAPPVALAGGVDPVSGPVLGGTLVSVRVVNCTSTVATLPSYAVGLKCRFGSSAVEASHWYDGGTAAGLRCYSPGGGAQSTSLALSINGQQYTHAASFTFYEEPLELSSTPRGGPSNGGTLITVNGAYLHGGSAYRCRLGAVD
eukprot:7367045-Prymnesium_polylepis.1